MANPPTQTYVDPSIDADSGAGTIGDPYGDLQHALDTITQDTTDGDQINIKAGTAEVLAARLTLATYGSASTGYPLIFRGYTSVADDGGVAEIDCQTDEMFLTDYDYIALYDLEIHDGAASSQLVELGNYCVIARCYVHDCASRGVFLSGSYSQAHGNRIENVGSSSHDAILMDNFCGASFNYIKQGASRTMRRGIGINGNTNVLNNNIISIDGASDGIYNPSKICSQIVGNTILSDGGTGVGIDINGTNAYRGLVLYNNYVEGFSGTGGIGLYLPTASAGPGFRGFNAVYNNTTNASIANETIKTLNTDPEVLSNSGLEKSGSDTFANRLTYFAPKDEGAMQDGAMQPGGAPG